MNVKEEKICRLCLKVVENDFQIIDGTTRKMFEGLLLRVNLDISKDPIICKDCAEVVEKCFNFKSICINTEKLDGDIENVDNFVCRFCSNHLSGNNFVLLATLMNNVTFAKMLLRLMPEIDFNIIKNPVICTSCKQDLECYIKFVENCLDVEEKITKYFQNEGTPFSTRVKLSEIEHYSFKNISDLDQKCAIKKEEVLEDTDMPHSEVYDSELIKTEEALDIKDEVNFDEIACKTPSDMAVYKVNIPSVLKTKIGEAWKALVQNRSFPPTTADHRTCTCDAIHNSCIKCENQFNTSSSETGMENTYQMLNTKSVSNALIFKCSICAYETKDKKNLKRHMLIHKDIIDVNMYKCSMCTYKTKDKSKLIRHMLIHKDIQEVERYKCSMCTYETKYKSCLKTHMLIHKNITEVEMYKCSLCTYEAKEKRRLKRHMLIHKDIAETAMYQCSMCTFRGKHKWSFLRHMLVHKDVTEVEMYKCTMCTFETKRKDGLKNHMITHKDMTEMEMYKCSVCTYEAKEESGLKDHMLIHKDITGLEMYKCSMCNFRGKQKSSLVRHMLIHKDVTEVELYKCSMCTFQGKYKRSLVRHMLTHKGITEVEMYKCSMCTYQAKLKNKLKIHMLVHKDVREVKMYKCSMCTHETKRKDSLKRHMLIHKDITEMEIV